MLALGGYFYYFIFAWNDFFYTKEQGGLIVVAVGMFLVTFFCGFIILFTASKKGISNEISLSDIKRLPRVPLVILGIVCVAEIIVLLLIVHNGALPWMIGVLIISFIFVIGEMSIIPKIVKSSIYKITLPWYVFPIPFVIFIGGEFYFSDVLPQDVFDTVGIVIFALCGVFLASIAWHGYYVIDDEQKTLEKNKGILSEFSRKKDIIEFSEIRYYEKKPFAYIVVSDEKVYKISRLYDSSNEIEMILDDNGVIRKSKDL